MRPVLKYQERKRNRVLENTFDIIKNQAIKFKKSDYKSSQVILNIALYFLIATRDIQAIKIDALTHPDPWKRNLSIRIILLTLHEWDMDKVSGKKLKQAFDDSNVSKNIQNEAFEALREVRQAQKRAKKQLGFLRNSTIAHRDPDALLQYCSIRDIDENAVLQLAAEFYEGSTKFVSLLPKIMLEIGSMPGLFSQIKAKYSKSHSER